MTRARGLAGTRAARDRLARSPSRGRLLRLLLLAVPATIVLRFAGARPIWLFVAASLAIIPLAGLMGQATEQLAERLGPGIGGLLNATFGNAAELIIALFALFKGYDDVVKASLAGQYSRQRAPGAGGEPAGRRVQEPHSVLQSHCRRSRCDNARAGLVRAACAGHLSRAARGRPHATSTWSMSYRSAYR